MNKIKEILQKKLHADNKQQAEAFLDAIGGEPLIGSGFEDEEEAMEFSSNQNQE